MQFIISWSIQKLQHSLNHKGEGGVGKVKGINRWKLIGFTFESSESINSESYTYIRPTCTIYWGMGKQ
ncbi:hypothetical protein MUK42_35991 [Musa troglodytarum]|uniref:Uncharacterized protein n=1 Tax=Musa troglodytarum TaxID=320322 RepID=A0A9E7FFX1_9LILI|nr:hypothetical protein MUK42_35991 [Musa troglodytarum]